MITRQSEAAESISDKTHHVERGSTLSMLAHPLSSAVSFRQRTKERAARLRKLVR
jgi:hypothetical protein